MARTRGSGGIYSRNGTWWIKYYRNSLPLAESSGSRDRRDAAALLKRRLAEIQTGTYRGPEIERVMVAELAQDLLTNYRANRRRSIGNAEARWELHLKPFFENLRAVEVTSALLDRYVAGRLSEGAQPSTCNREMALLKRAFNLARKGDKVRAVPSFPHLKENNVRTGFAPDGAHKKLTEYCPELWFRTFVELARTVAWRKMSILNLRVRQVDLLTRSVRLDVGSTKNDDGPEVVMTQALYILFSECVRGKAPDDYVFTRKDGKRVKDFRKLWKNACQHAGLPGLHIHDLRRTAVRMQRRAGVAEQTIMKQAGMRSRSIFERYNITDQSDVVEAMQKFEAYERAQQQRAERERENGYSTVTIDQKSVQVAKDDIVN